MSPYYYATQPNQIRRGARTASGRGARGERGDRSDAFKSEIRCFLSPSARHRPSFVPFAASPRCRRRPPVLWRSARAASTTAAARIRRRPPARWSPRSAFDFGRHADHNFKYRAAVALASPRLATTARPSQRTDLPDGPRSAARAIDRVASRPRPKRRTRPRPFGTTLKPKLPTGRRRWPAHHLITVRPQRPQREAPYLCVRHTLRTWTCDIRCGRRVTDCPIFSPLRIVLSASPTIYTVLRVLTTYGPI